MFVELCDGARAGAGAGWEGMVVESLRTVLRYCEFGGMVVRLHVASVADLLGHVGMG